MNKNIRPGILVRIACDSSFARSEEDLEVIRLHDGKIGEVLREAEPDFITGVRRWKIDGADHDGRTCFADRHLHPIDDGIVDDLIQVWQINSRQGVTA